MGRKPKKYSDLKKRARYMRIKETADKIDNILEARHLSTRLDNKFHVEPKNLVKKLSLLFLIKALRLSYNQVSIFYVFHYIRLNTVKYVTILFESRVRYSTIHFTCEYTQQRNIL